MDIHGEPELIVEALSVAQERNNTLAVELWEWRNRLIERAAAWYPESVFLPAKPGEPYLTQDAAAAAMARHVLRLIADELGERSIELHTDPPGDDDDDRDDDDRALANSLEER